MEKGVFIGTALVNGQTVTDLPDCWHLELKFNNRWIDCKDSLISLKADGKDCLVLSNSQDSLECRIYADAMETPICLAYPRQFASGIHGTDAGDCSGKVSEECSVTDADESSGTVNSECAGHEISVTFRPHHAVMHVDGILADEDWPLGAFCGCRFFTASMHDTVVSARIDGISASSEAEPDVIGRFTGTADNWRPAGHNTGVGDCMPLFHEGRFHLFYLFDRRGHRSKYGLGAHQWAHISSADLKTWDIHPLAIAIDSQWEGSICTGSVLPDNGILHAFYAARTCDGSAARLSVATSTDGIRFQKTRLYFTLKAPYEPSSARDPFVFMDESGLFHMLVTTSVANERGEYEGCLAHLVSTDLEQWSQMEPYLVVGSQEQPECCDMFGMNGWQYLIYSLGGIARYRMSRSPFGPWVKPEVDIIENMRYRVPKTAAFTGGRRIAIGFVTAEPEAYAGKAVFRELVQGEDGTLTTRPIYV
jgi:beta-fructofuranosidase